MVIKALEGAKGRLLKTRVKRFFGGVSYAGHLAKTNPRNLKNFSSDVLIITWLFINNILVGKLPESMIQVFFKI